MALFDKLFKKKDKMEPIIERNFFNIEINDIISYELEDYQVIGKLIYNDHGFKWYGYQLQGETKTIWLSSEMDDELELGIYERIKLPIKEPIQDKITFEGITYFLDEQGKATVNGEGRSGNLNNLEMSYYDFSDQTEEYFLSIEIWGTEIEVSKGFAIDDYEIKIIAGS